jgi:hypothetical protein
VEAEAGRMAEHMSASAQPRSEILESQSVGDTLDRHRGDFSQRSEPGDLPADSNIKAEPPLSPQHGSAADVASDDASVCGASGEACAVPDADGGDSHSDDGAKEAVTPPAPVDIDQTSDVEVVTSPAPVDIDQTSPATVDTDQPSDVELPYFTKLATKLINEAALWVFQVALGSVTFVVWLPVRYMTGDQISWLELLGAASWLTGAAYLGNRARGLQRRRHESRIAATAATSAAVMATSSAAPQGAPALVVAAKEDPQRRSPKKMAKAFSQVDLDQVGASVATSERELDEQPLFLSAGHMPGFGNPEFEGQEKERKEKEKEKEKRKQEKYASQPSRTPLLLAM